jgi:FkbM family methyltransferase
MKKIFNNLINKKLREYIKKSCPILLNIYKLYLFNKRYSKNEFITNIEKEIAEKFYIYLKNTKTENKIEKINKLKKGLDEKSKEEIDNILFRYNIFARNNFINKKKLFTSQELNEQNKFKKINLKNYKDNFTLNGYAPEVFYGVSGLKWLPKKQKSNLINGTFLDIGAYNGDSALSFYFTFSPKKIYAFEPQSRNFKILLENSKRISKNVISPIKKGVSNKIKTSNISNEFNTSKLTKNKKFEEIEIITIDNFVFKNQIKKIDLIKMDIEGEETNALLGAKKTIIKYKPTLTISIYHNPQDFFEIKSYLEKLVPEYKFIIKKANPFSHIFELMLIAYIN